MKLTINNSLQVGVKVLLKNRNGEFLILKRLSGKGTLISGLWDIPGGRINQDESLFDGLKREVFEEVKISIDVRSLKIVGAQDIFYGSNNHVVRITFEGNIVDSNIFLSSEHTEFKWCNIGDILKLDKLDPYLREILERYI